MAKSSAEIERKYAVDWDYRLPDLSGLATVRDDGTATLVNAYFDTEELHLTREGVTLRRRTGGADAGWHLKLPPAEQLRSGGALVSGDGPRVRTEVQVPAKNGRPADRPPGELLDLIRVLIGDRALAERGRVRTRRTTLTLLAEDGTEIVELADDWAEVISAGGVAEKFHEVEVEDRPGATGNPEIVRALLDTLTATGAVPSSAPSKSARALGAESLGGPDVAEPPTLTPESPATDAVRAHLRRYARALRWEDVLVRLEAEDAVHQLRVATRRLRSGLRAYLPLLDAGWAGPLRTELRWLAHGFAAARDAEVQLARLVGHAQELGRIGGADEDDVADVQAFLRRRLGAEQDAGRAEGLGLLASEQYLQLHDSLVVAANEPAVLPAAERPCAKALPPLAKRAWRKLDQAVRRLGPEAPDEVWHAARISAKRARYVVDGCATALGKPAAKLASRLASVTDVLGEHQDAVVATHTLVRLATAGRVPARTAYWLGVLAAHERGLALAARERFAGVWAEAGRAKFRRWFD
ncbi:CYTH and CHAD domain-containing protein [Flindersiella endophytica]